MDDLPYKNTCFRCVLKWKILCSWSVFLLARCWKDKLRPDASVWINKVKWDERFPKNIYISQYIYNNLCSKVVTVLYIVRHVFLFFFFVLFIYLFIFTWVFLLFKRNVRALGQNLLDLSYECPHYQKYFKLTLQTWLLKM